jgi:hypothetical protein
MSFCCLELAPPDLEHGNHEEGEHLIRPGQGQRLSRQCVGLVPAAELEECLSCTIHQVGLMPVPGQAKLRYPFAT